MNFKNQVIRCWRGCKYYLGREVHCLACVMGGVDELGDGLTTAPTILCASSQAERDSKLIPTTLKLASSTLRSDPTYVSTRDRPETTAPKPLPNAKTLQSPSCLLLLNLVHKIKVAFIKMMYTHIPIFTTARVASSLWIHRYGIEWSEMSLYSTYLILKDSMVEASFEFTLPRRCCCHVHCGLTTAENYEVFFGGYGCGIKGSVGDIGFEDLKISGGYNLGRLAWLGSWVRV